MIGKILEKVRDESAQESRHHSVGVYRASEIAGCPRALQYATLGYSAEQFSPELHLIFRDGHAHHNAVRELLAKVGTLSHVEKTISKKYKHAGTSFTITGTVDCVWNGKVVDIKSISTFRFKLVNKEDWQQEFIGYVEQVNLYMDMLGLNEGGILFKDKNSAELAFKETSFDPKFLNDTLDMVADVHKGVKKKKITIEQPYAATSFMCKTCAYRLPCRRLPMESKRWSVSFQNPSGDDLTGKLRESVKAGKKARRS